MATAHYVYSATGGENRSVNLGDAHLEHSLLPQAEWKAGKKEYAVMLTLALISLMVSLDATILVPALPVSDAYAFLRAIKERSGPDED